MSRLWAIVPAAGAGNRMQAAQPKQYLCLAGRPVLLHTLLRLRTIPDLHAIMLVLDAADQYWDSLGADWPDSAPPLLHCAGGKERVHSVLNGLVALQSLPDPAVAGDWILVHDAARPALRVSDVQRLLQQIRHHPVGGLLALPVADTLKRADGAGQVIETVDRSALWQAQTPQVFRFELLLTALQQAVKESRHVTDEASALEQAGHQPLLVRGSPDNIKLTWPLDLQLLTAILHAQQAADSPVED